MKKKALLLVMVMSVGLGCTPAFAAEKVQAVEHRRMEVNRIEERSSNYIAAFGVEVHDIYTGKAEVYASMVRVGGSSHRITVILQEKVSGNWEDVDDIKFSSSKVSSTHVARFSTKSNHTYRFKGVFEVKKNGEWVESRAATTGPFKGK